MLAPNNLFNIQREYLQLLGQIEEAEGEITPEIEQALQFTESKMQEAGVNLGLVIKAMEYWIDDIDEEQKRLDGLKAKAVKSKELLKNRLTAAMQQFGIERISSPTINLSFRKSEAIEITEESAIPAAYLIMPPPYPGKTLIKEAIKKGITVPGAELVQRKSLQIK